MIFQNKIDNFILIHNNVVIYMYDIALALTLKEFCSKLYFTFTGAFFSLKKSLLLK